MPMYASTVTIIITVSPDEDSGTQPGPILKYTSDESDQIINLDPMPTDGRGYVQERDVTGLEIDMSSPASDFELVATSGNALHPQSVFVILADESGRGTAAPVRVAEWPTDLWLSTEDEGPGYTSGAVIRLTDPPVVERAPSVDAAQ